MEIVSSNLVGYYRYKPDFEVITYGVKQEIKNECIICKRTLCEPSYETVSDNKNIFRETEILIGKCGHMFHGDCLNQWLKNNNTCPSDNIKWCLHHIADTTTTLVLDRKSGFNKYNSNLIMKKFNNARAFARKKQLGK